MKKDSSPLDNIRIATPCTAKWEDMIGDDRSRFCLQCNLNVYNISGMGAEEAASLITNAGARLCIRGYQRADGTILTQDCPVGLRAISRRAALSVRAAVTVAVTFVAGIIGVSSAQTKPREVMMGKMVAPRHEPPRDTLQRDTAQRVDTVQIELPVMMGEVRLVRPIDTINTEIDEEDTIVQEVDVTPPQEVDDMPLYDAVEPALMLPIEKNLIIPDDPVVTPEPYVDPERPELQ